MIKGTAASYGIGIGKAFIVNQKELTIAKNGITDKEAEKTRFADALTKFCDETMKNAEIVKEKVGEPESEILIAHTVLAQDPELIKEVNTLIEKESVCGEYAFADVCDRYIMLFGSLEDELIKARAADFRDIKNNVLCIMMGIKKVDLTQAPTGSVLVAEDISPSQAAMLDPKKVAGIITQIGTKVSHIAIIARAMQIPAVVAIDNLLGIVQDGDELIVDGLAGEVYLKPTQAELDRYKKGQEEEAAKYEELLLYKDKETLTKDGKKVLLAANLAVTKELELINDHCADGIGLFRTEFLYMNTGSLPTEEQQFTCYREIAEGLHGKEVIIRTLDIGGDKDIPYMGLTKEENPFLGYRAIRFCLNRTDIFRTQMRALLRASAFGNIKIMIPMISQVSEVTKSKEIIEEIKAELKSQGIDFDEDIKVGIMIETPAAAVCAEMFAKEVDFFSIGTNDLTQYVLAVDRGNENVAELYSPFHPAVLRLIKSTVEGAAKYGIPVGVCGEAASYPLMIPLLVGIGVDELSVSSSSILSVRKQLSSLSKEYWQSQVEKVLALSSAQEVIEFVMSRKNVV